MGAPHSTRDKYLTTGQVCRRFGVQPGTVRGWCERGYLPGSFQVEGRGRWYISERAVESFAARMAEASEKSPDAECG